MLAVCGAGVLPRSVSVCAVLFGRSMRRSQGHVELIHGEPRLLFISDPRVVSAGRALSVQCADPENPFERIYLIWPFFNGSKCFFSPKAATVWPGSSSSAHGHGAVLIHTGHCLREASAG